MAALTEQAYQRLRQQILDGELPAEERLGEEELALALGISRTPVREALRRLAVEGLVEVLPNRGARVAKWDPSDLDEIFELRALLEAHGARRAALNATDEVVDQLAEWCTAMEAEVAKKRPDLTKVADLNRQFHAVVLEMSGCTRLPGLVASLVYVPIVMHTFSTYSPEALARSLGHHRELVAALRKRDGNWAHAVWTAHLSAAPHAMHDPAGA